MTSPGPYQTIAKSRKTRALGSDNPGTDPGRPKNVGSDDPEASDWVDLEADVEAPDEEDVEEDVKEDAKEDDEEDDEQDADKEGSGDSDQSAGTNTSDISRRKMAKPRP